MRKNIEDKRAYERAWRKGKTSDPVYMARKAASDARWRRQHLARFAAAKLERGCDRCDFNDCAQALQYHHLPGFEKLYDLGKSAGSLGKAKLAAEIAKCSLLCANCHAMEHCRSNCCNKDI